MASGCDLGVDNSYSRIHPPFCYLDFVPLMLVFLFDIKLLLSYILQNHKLSRNCLSLTCMSLGNAIDKSFTLFSVST